jgi:YihY family inner membrane protein
VADESREDADPDPDAGEPAEERDGEPPQRNLFDRVTDRLDAVQRRVAVLAVVHGVVKKYGEDRGGQLAMLLAYRGFFSVFPLLLAFVAAVGLVLSGNPELRDDLIDSTLATVPVIGAEIERGADAFGGSVVVVVGSILVALWAGLGLLEMIQESLNTVWGVPLFERPNWFVRRLRAVPAAVVVGGCLVLSGSRSWLVDGFGQWVGRLAAFLLPFLAGALCYLGLHWLLCQRKVPFRAQLPGAAFVGLAWWALQSLGEFYVDRFVVRSSDTYGVFVIVFGLLSWSYLLGLLYLYGNELASVLADHRWPRSLTGRDLTDEDRRAFALVSEREVRVRGTAIDVEVPREPAPGP